MWAGWGRGDMLLTISLLCSSLFALTFSQTPFLSLKRCFKKILTFKSSWFCAQIVHASVSLRQVTETAELMLLIHLKSNEILHWHYLDYRKHGKEIVKASLLLADCVRDFKFLSFSDFFVVQAQINFVERIGRFVPGGGQQAKISRLSKCFNISLTQCLQEIWILWFSALFSNEPALQ